jgi:hypothetical protein
MRIMILAYSYYGYGQSIAKAFRALGCEVVYCEYSVPSEGLGAIMRYSLPRKMGFDVEVAVRENYGRRVSEEISSFCPEGILIVRGDFHTEFIETAVKALSSRPKIALWIMDGVKRLPGILKFRNCVNHWFVFEPTDIPILKKEYGINSEFLPLAFDSDKYYPLSSDISDRGLKADVSFVGSVMDVDRRKMINSLARWSRTQKIDFKIISGNLRARYYPYLFPYSSLRKCLWKKHLEHQEINIFYNNCFSNLNIHASQSVEGLNMRFFEILGSGGLQIVEQKKAQTELGFIPDRDFLTYSNFKELQEKIEFSLKSPEKAKIIALSGHKHVKNHDFVARAKFIMEKAFS